MKGQANHYAMQGVEWVDHAWTCDKWELKYNGIAMASAKNKVSRIYGDLFKVDPA